MPVCMCICACVSFQYLHHFPNSVMTAMDRSVIQLSALMEMLQQLNIDGYEYRSLVCQAAVTNALLSLLCAYIIRCAYR
jgi:hypothetical protein